MNGSSLIERSQESFAGMSNEDLLVELRERLSNLATAFLDLARIVGEAVRRDIDLSEVEHLNPRIIADLRRIESGQVLPELAEKYMHTRAWSRVQTLPIGDQKALIESGKVPVVVRRGDQFDVRKMDVAHLKGEQVSLVFDRGRIRSREEQIVRLEADTLDEQDEFDEATVCVRLPATDLEMTKKQRKRFTEMKERAGSTPDLVRSLILKAL